MSNAIQELSYDELDLIVGGSISSHDAFKFASSVVKLLTAIATIVTMVLAII